MGAVQNEAPNSTNLWPLRAIFFTIKNVIYDRFTNRTSCSKFFEEWKKVFESDPIDRKKPGVCRYRILRPINQSTHVIVDLEFGKFRTC